jgi:3-phenylpropionate/trans-cinnamate dioxygenase ferredoxin reductase component
MSATDVPDSRGMVVVGAGECGAQAALQLRENGWSGHITLIGDEAIETYERPPLSKAMLASDDAVPVHPVSRTAFDDAGIDVLRPERVTGIEPAGHRVVLASGRTIGYDRLLLAVGAQPRRLPIPASAGALYLRTHEDALTLRPHLRPGRRVGILGAGFIGLELAAAANLRGCEVTVIEFAPRALARAVPADIAAAVVRRHVERGVRFRFGVVAEEYAPEGDHTHVRLSSGEVLPFDTLIVGVGAVPDTALAEQAGLRVANGIELTDRLRTSDPDIFAAGDCGSFPHPLFGGTRIRLEAWRNAHDQAQTVARNMLGADRPHTAIPWFWSDQYDCTLQVTGLPQLADRQVVRHRPDGVELHFGLDPAGRLVSASAFGPGNAVAKDIRLVELLLQRDIHPDAARLIDAAVPLKRLLAGAGTPA